MKEYMMNHLPQIIAHRGARSLAPENTLCAAQKAIDVGSNMWELDVQMTKDHELVVIHDSTLERTTNVKNIFEFESRKPWPVQAFTYEELKRLDAGAWFYENNTQLHKEKNSSKITIPTLKQALLLTKQNQFKVNIEIKDVEDFCHEEIIVSQVLNLINELDMMDQCLLSSLNFSIIQKIKQLNPHVKTGIVVESTINDPISLLNELGAVAFHPSIDILNLDLVNQLLSHGYQVNVWTVNDKKTMQQLIQWRVSGIFTDYPQHLVQLLKQMTA